jgi:hypothetical protein
MTPEMIDEIIKKEFAMLNNAGEIKPWHISLCLVFWHKGYAKGCDDMSENLKNAYAAGYGKREPK